MESASGGTDTRGARGAVVWDIKDACGSHGSVCTFSQGYLDATVLLYILGGSAFGLLGAGTTADSDLRLPSRLLLRLTKLSVVGFKGLLVLTLICSRVRSVRLSVVVVVVPDCLRVCDEPDEPARSPFVTGTLCEYAVCDIVYTTLEQATSSPCASTQLLWVVAVGQQVRARLNWAKCECDDASKRVSVHRLHS